MQIPISISLGNNGATVISSPNANPLDIPLSNGFNLNDFLNYTFQLHQQQRSGPPPASKSALEQLPQVKVTEAHVQGEAHCSICRDAFNKDESVLCLPCEHFYHSDCIKPWLHEHNTCPVCRYELPTDDAEYEKDRQQRMKKWDEAIRQRSVKCELGLMQNEECVLLENNGEPLMTELECEHTFHSECLNTWWNIAGPGRCPKCRKTVARKEAQQEPRKKRKIDQEETSPMQESDESVPPQVDTRPRGADSASHHTVNTNSERL